MAPTTRLPFSDLSNRQLFPSVTCADATHKPFKTSLQSKPPKPANKEFIVVGSWTRVEHLAFLHGLRLYGPGKWKKLCDLIPTRDNIQIKSHGQLLLRKQRNGINIFRELDDYYHQEHLLEQQVHPIMRGHTMGQNDQYFRHGLQLTGPEYGYSTSLHAPQSLIRPPSDVIQAACGLALLSDAPKCPKN